MDKSKSLHKGHRERLRQRIINQDVDSLEPHELLEFLLFFAIPRQDVNALSHTLIDHCGGFCEVFSAEPEKLLQVKGLGTHASQWLNTLGKCLSVCGRLNEDSRPTIRTPHDLLSFARGIEGKYPSPCALQICIDVHNRINYCRVMCQSLDWGDAKILRSAIQDVIYTTSFCAAIVVFTGMEVLEPKSDYISWAQQYNRALKAVDSRLLDVMLVGTSECHSLFIRSASGSSDMEDVRIQKRWLHEEYLGRVEGTIPDYFSDENPYL